MFTFQIDEQDLKIIMAALGELPFKMSYQVINKLESQIQSQSSNQGDDVDGLI